MIIRPRPRTSPMTAYFSCKRFAPASSRSPRRGTLGKSSRSTTSRVASAAAQHTRLDPLMLARPHFAGPSYAALYLVAHEQDAVAVAQLPQSLQIAGRRHHVAALALDRLHEHRRDALRVQPLGEQVVLDRRHTPHGARGLGVAEVAVVAIAVGHVVHL